MSIRYRAVVKTPREEVPERRRVLQRLANSDGGLYGENLIIVRQGYKVRHAWLEERLQALLEAAEALDSQS